MVAEQTEDRELILLVREIEKSGARYAIDGYFGREEGLKQLDKLADEFPEFVDNVRRLVFAEDKVMEQFPRIREKFGVEED